MEQVIRATQIGDIPRIAELYDLARVSLRGLGIDQWQDGYLNADSAREDIWEGRGWVLEEHGLILATAAVYVGHEPTYDRILDGKWLTEADRYGIIHRIAVAPEARNRGAASAIMTFCSELTRAAGLASQRCDTHHGNAVMRRTLEKNGYVFCGTIILQSGAARAAYEKVL